jgi:preprotein translocase subunit SecB
MTMTKKYKILSKFVKDMSSETPNVETYLHVKDHISKYQLNIEINSKAIKNELIEINTTFQFKEPQEKSKKSFFEINFATIVKVDEEAKKNKDELERIILCDTQTEIYPELEKIFLSLLESSGYPGIKFEKKVDFEKLYSQRFN